MNWKCLESIDDLDNLDMESGTVPVLIYKHSTRCGICLSVKAELDAALSVLPEGLMKPHYLDLIKHRQLSDTIVQRYHVQHQSPQALLIADGKCFFNASHYEIKFDDLQRAILSRNQIPRSNRKRE